MKYEDEYGHCFDDMIRSFHTKQGYEIDDLLDLFYEWNIKINDESGLRDLLYEFFEKCHELKYIEPAGRKYGYDDGFDLEIEKKRRIVCTGRER